MKYVNLTNLFRLHAVLAVLYAIGLLLLPQTIIGLLAPTPLNAPGADITRLFGAALVLVAMLAWGASQQAERAVQRGSAQVLLVYVTLGLIITLLGQLARTWGPLGWSNVVAYAIFVVGYGYFLFVKPE